MARRVARCTYSATACRRTMRTPHVGTPSLRRRRRVARDGGTTSSSSASSRPRRGVSSSPMTSTFDATPSGHGPARHDRGLRARELLLAVPVRGPAGLLVLGREDGLRATQLVVRAQRLLCCRSGGTTPTQPEQSSSIVVRRVVLERRARLGLAVDIVVGELVSRLIVGRHVGLVRVNAVLGRGGKRSELRSGRTSPRPRRHRTCNPRACRRNHTQTRTGSPGRRALGRGARTVACVMETVRTVTGGLDRGSRRLREPVSSSPIDLLAVRNFRRRASRRPRQHRRDGHLGRRSRLVEELLAQAPGLRETRRRHRSRGPTLCREPLDALVQISLVDALQGDAQSGQARGRTGASTRGPKNERAVLSARAPGLATGSHYVRVLCGNQTLRRVHTVDALCSMAWRCRSSSSRSDEPGRRGAQKDR